MAGITGDPTAARCGTYAASDGGLDEDGHGASTITGSYAVAGGPFCTREHAAMPPANATTATTAIEPEILTVTPSRISEMNS